MKLILTILVATIANFVWADEGVDITNPTQVLELVKIQERLDSVSTAVMGCMDSGREHNACLCQYKELIIQFNRSVNNLFPNHPSLEKYILSDLNPQMALGLHKASKVLENRQV